MGVGKQEKWEQRALRCLTACGAMVIGASLLFLLYSAGCVKAVPQEDTPSPESKASKIEPENSAAAPTVAEAAVPAAVEPVPEANKEKSPAFMWAGFF